MTYFDWLIDAYVDFSFIEKYINLSHYIHDYFSRIDNVGEVKRILKGKDLLKALDLLRPFKLQDSRFLSQWKGMKLSLKVIQSVFNKIMLTALKHQVLHRVFLNNDESINM